MSIEEVTASQGLQLPHAGNRLEVDVLRLRAALTLADQILAAHGGSLDAFGAEAAQIAQALQTHKDGSNAHTPAQVGLGNVNNTADADKPVSTATALALAGKQAALQSGVNIKTIGGQSLLGGGNLEVAQWTAATSGPADDGTDLVKNRRYAVDAAATYSRYLPAAPAVGDRIALLNSGGHFGNGLFWLRRRNAAHTVNGLAEDVQFNFPAGFVTVEYAAANKWVLA